MTSNSSQNDAKTHAFHEDSGLTSRQFLGVALAAPVNLAFGGFSLLVYSGRIIITMKSVSDGNTVSTRERQNLIIIPG